MKSRLLIITTSVVTVALVVGLINYKQQPTFLTSKYIQYKIGLFIKGTAQHDDMIFVDSFEKAAKYLHLSVDKGQSDREIFYNLFVCYDMSHQDDKAEITLDKAIEFYSDDFEFRYLRGEKRKELKKHRLAFEDFNAALTIGAESRAGKEEEVLLRNTSAEPNGKKIVFNFTMPRQAMVDFIKKQLAAG